jgi:hypothetical protein
MGVEYGPGSLAGALGLLGVGIAMIFPDNKWIGGIFVLAAIAVLFFDIRITGWQLSGQAPIARDRPLAFWGMLLFGIAFLGCSVLYFQPFLTRQEQRLPGFTSYAVIRLYDTPESRRRYVYEFVSSQGGKASFYLSASSIFTFAATDVGGEAYPLEVKIGDDGIPIDQFVVLFCEVGVTDTSTTMRILVNDKEVARRDLAFPLNLGRIDWKPGALGAPVTGINQGGVFLLSEFGVYPTTLTSAEIQGLVKNANEFYKRSITTVPAAPKQQNFAYVDVLPLNNDATADHFAVVVNQTGGPLPNVNFNLQNLKDLAKVYQMSLPFVPQDGRPFVPKGQEHTLKLSSGQYSVVIESQDGTFTELLNLRATDKGLKKEITVLPRNGPPLLHIKDD